MCGGGRGLEMEWLSFDAKRARWLLNEWVMEKLLERFGQKAQLLLHTTFDRFVVEALIPETSVTRHTDSPPTCTVLQQCDQTASTSVPVKFLPQSVPLGISFSI